MGKEKDGPGRCGAGICGDAHDFLPFIENGTDPIPVTYMTG